LGTAASAITVVQNARCHRKNLALIAVGADGMLFFVAASTGRVTEPLPHHPFFDR
jgi:hypothetical protein